MMYTLEDLEAAKADFTIHDSKWSRYTGNNPRKHVADRDRAAAKVAMIENHLKSAGLLPWSDQELLERALDVAFPNAISKQEVEHEGSRYRRVFTLMSRSGKNNVWHKSWQLLK